MKSGKGVFRFLRARGSVSAFLLTTLTGIFISCSDHSSSSQGCIAEKGNYIYLPATDLGELFSDVEMAAVFPDSKTFADCNPQIPPDSLILLYREQNANPSFSPETFVSFYFDCPETETPHLKKLHTTDIVTHLIEMWKVLERKPDPVNGISSLLPLSYPYIVPGGRFREIYYWDSYFTMEGLAASDRLDMIINMLNNFACLIERYRFIPNGNRSYYLSRSQPPFFAEMIKLVMREMNDSAGLKYLPALEKEYLFWMRSNNPASSQHVIKLDSIALNRYWDRLSEPRTESYREDILLAETVPPANQNSLYQNLRSSCESGWDFSSRWMRDPEALTTICTTDILPVDLNCLLYNLEKTLSVLYQNDGQIDMSIEFAIKAFK